MSVAAMGAGEFGQALACGILALRQRVPDRSALVPAVRGIAEALAQVAEANRKTYAARYKEIPGRAPSADQIMQSAKPFLAKVVTDPTLCAPYQGGTPVDGLMYNVDPKYLPEETRQTLQGLHTVIEAWNPLNAREAEKRARAERLSHVAAGRYPWKEVHRSPDGSEYERDKYPSTYTKDLAAALREATGRSWSVSKRPGSSYVTADAPPARRTCEWDGITPAPKGQGYSCADDRQVLGNLLNGGRPAHPQGETISPDPGCRENAYDLVKGRPDPMACRHDWDR